MAFPVAPIVAKPALVLTNAVLLAILPDVSEFARKTELPIPLPITTNHIAHFTQLGKTEELSGILNLTNGSHFVYTHGHVSSFGITLQPIPANERVDLRAAQHKAVALAHRFIDRLGYSEKDLYLHLEPDVRCLEQRTQVYEVEWPKPHNPDTFASSVSLAIYLPAQQVIGGSLHNFRLRKTPPFHRLPEELRPKDDGKAFSLELTKEEKNALFEQWGPALNEFITALKLPLRSLTQSSVLEMESTNKTRLSILLTNRFVFYIQSGKVTGFDSPDTFFAFDKEVDFDQFVGEAKYTENQCIKLVSKAVQELGYSPAKLGLNLKPKIHRPRVKPPVEVPRRHFFWLKKIPGASLLMAEAEVDMQSGEMKSLGLHSLVRELESAR